MKYSLKDIAGSLPAEKRKADGTVTTLILRPLSWPAAWLFLRLGASANAVTALSMLFSAAGLALTMTTVPALHALAVGFFFVFGVLDCADGNMARTMGSKNPFGGWVDAAGGYFTYFAQMAAIALSARLPGGQDLRIPFSGITLVAGNDFPGIWLFVATLSVSANLLMRLYHQAFKNAELLAGIRRPAGNEKRFSEEIGITGYMPVLYALGLAFGCLPWVSLFYLFIYGGGFCVTAFRLFRRASAPIKTPD